MDAFAYEQYLFRRKFFTFIHTDFFFQSPAGTTVLWGRKKGFKLKEDIRIYEDASLQREVLSIQARRALDFSGTYDVVDSRDQRRVGVMKRKGLRSILRDEWQLLDGDEKPLGKIEEDSQGLALFRRFVSNIVPQSFQAVVGGTPVAEFKQQFNPFKLRINIDFALDSRRQLDRRLGIAAAALLGTIEGRQED